MLTYIVLLLHCSWVRRLPPVDSSCWVTRESPLLLVAWYGTASVGPRRVNQNVLRLVVVAVGKRAMAAVTWVVAWTSSEDWIPFLRVVLHVVV